MSGLPRLVYAAVLVALLCACIGVFVAEAWHGKAAVSVIRGSKQGADPDYVEGLAKLGIVYLPGYARAPVVLGPIYAAIGRAPGSQGRRGSIRPVGRCCRRHWPAVSLN